MGWDGLGVDWVGKGDGRLWGEDVEFGIRFGRVKSGLRRLCVVCATTRNCCKCNNFIQIHAPG